MSPNNLAPAARYGAGAAVGACAVGRPCPLPHSSTRRLPSPKRTSKEPVAAFHRACGDHSWRKTLGERQTVLHSWCVQADWNAPTVVGGEGARFFLADGRAIL